MFVDCDVVVGPVCCRFGRCWICPFSNIQRLNDSIQDVSWIVGHQFDVMLANTNRFIQMGFMVMGGSLEADRRIRQYEARIRLEKRMVKDREVWDQYEEEYEESASQQRKSR